ncbi:sugar transferase [Pseudobythopirellula maris]|uniref:sugar transferase n=1 Tax=Pseudobythopirellula maris TaxID=2527991 RepID=UPI0018D49015|nr:sugar transferase [Pseudobythopirellula maris]
MSAITDLPRPIKVDSPSRRPPIQPSSYLGRKRAVVRVLGAIAGALLAPLIVLLVILVRLTSPGPGLYRQCRLGLNGREFTIFKLRSMRNDAEKLSGPVWAKRQDARVTPLGRLLRFTHLDELPQIINVVRGEMDFVGPRPERPEIVADLVGQVPGYEDRLAALPGITGVAQVNLPPDETLDCVRKKVAADRYYIEKASLWLDLRLAAATFLRVLGIRYEKGAWLLGVLITPAQLLEAAEQHDLSCSEINRPHFPNVLRDESLEDTQSFSTCSDTVVEDGLGVPELSAQVAMPRQPR